MRTHAILLTLAAGLIMPASALAAAPHWRVQQACALQRYLRATPAFPQANWGQSANVSLGGQGRAVNRAEDVAARAQFDHAMRSGRAFADRAAEQLAVRERISQEEAFRRIGADPGPWPEVTAAKCQALERRALSAQR